MAQNHAKTQGPPLLTNLSVIMKCLNKHMYYFMWYASIQLNLIPTVVLLNPSWILTCNYISYLQHKPQLPLCTCCIPEIPTAIGSDAMILGFVTGLTRFMNNVS